MAKFALHLAIFALVLVFVNAFHTTITVDSEEQIPFSHADGSCDQQIREQNYLRHCQQFFQEEIEQGGSFDNRPGRSQHLDDCCEQLENLDRQCRCPGLEQVLQQGPWQMQRREIPDVSQIIETVMSKCQLKPRRCGHRQNHPGGSCQEQIKEQNYLSHCQQFFEEESEQGGSFDNRPGRSQHLDDCCEQLENLDKQCRCPGLEQVLQQGPSQMQRGELPEPSQVIERIMSKCQLEPRRCGPRITIQNRPGGSCQEQIIEQNNLRHCQQFFEESFSGGSFDNRPDRSKHLDDCCEQLENLDRKCRCPGLKQVLQQQQDGPWQMATTGSRKVSQVIERIMTKCQLEPRRCETQYLSSA